MANNGRPKVCAYCGGSGQADAANECGFCDGGVPLDTQEGWDRSWGRKYVYPGPTDHEEHPTRGD